METINLGRVAFVYKGDYSAVTTYNKMDVVFDGESSFVSQIDNNVGNPLVNGLNWKYLSRGNNLELQEAKQDIATLETNLKQTDIKNAEQDASIKSIEQLLSQSNMNQTAQVSSTGREIVSLPKTASNGGMEVKLEGLTAQNLVVNGDFRNGTTGYTPTNGTISATNNELIFTGNSSTTGTSVVVFTLPNITTNNKCYICFDFYILDNVTSVYIEKLGSFAAQIKSNPQTLTWSRHYGIYTAIGASANKATIVAIFSNSTNLNKTLRIRNVKTIDLTATFGSGNEPDLATCDAMFSTYFEGAKSFIPTGRVRSRVGINMFNPSDFVKNGVSKGLSSDYIKLSGNGIFNKTIPYVEKYFDYLKGCFEPNTQYTLKATGKISNYDDSRVNVKLQFTYTDMSVQSILFGSTESTVSMTSQSGKTISSVALSGWSYVGDVTIWDISLTKGITQVPYEPYKSTKLYLTAPDLRSNGNVKDEIRKGVNGYEHVKRVGVGTLGSNIVLNGGFDSTDNWIVPADRAIIANSAINIDVTKWDKDVRQSCNLNVGYYLAEFDIISVARGGTLTIHSDNAVYNSIGVAGRYRHIFYCKTAGLRALYVNSANIACSIDNISVRQIITSDIPTLINPVIFTSILPIVADNYIRFPIETPIITPIEHAGMLNSAESGTVFHEPVVADAGVYGTNISILNTTYPISSLEEIMVHTNVDTYLDASKAVIASDGLSFTHPDLRAGDIVLFTYFFNKEKVNGLITATYYDGRYVIADTANGKFYKWGVKSTNGVATINLTEV